MQNGETNGLGPIKKTREMTTDFKNQILNDRVYTCEKHSSRKTSKYVSKH